MLRRLPSMPQAEAEKFGEKMQVLAQKARHVIRDLNPIQDLSFLRIRAQKQEVMVAIESEFLVIIIQRWQPAS